MRFLDQCIALLEGEGKSLRKETVPAPESVLFDVDAAGKVYVQAIMPYVREALQDGALRTLGLVELGNEVWDVNNPEVEYWLKQKTLKIRTLPETMYDDIRANLMAVVRDGGTVADMAARLQEMRPGYEWYKAERIARTEIVGANNAGSWQTMRQNEIEWKEWSTAEDERVRPAARKPGSKPPKGHVFDHRAANGETVATDRPFVKTGEALMHPGAENGSAGNIIHCRCVVIPALEGPGA